ncbi:MAG TPA: hypothetical protein VMC86_11615 [Gemmatimonadales bacterium]|nr:hypothetical protein [Gemmatimonadales bacterium]
MRAAVIDSQGDTLKGATVDWSVSDSIKASVTIAGLVTDKAPGSFVVYAQSGSAVGGAFMNGSFPAAGILLPDSIVMRRYDSVQVFGLVVSASGTPVAGHVIAWSTPDTSLLAVNAAGVLTPRGTGRARLRAASGAVIDSTVVRIVPEPVAIVQISSSGAALYVGIPDTFVATPVDAKERPVGGALVAWLSRDTTVLRVVADTAHPGVGIATTINRGVTWLVATSGPAMDSVFLSVDRLITDWRFDPDTLIMAAGTWVLPIALGRDTTGVAHVYGPVTPVIPLDTAILSFDSRGVYALKPGVGRITGMVYGDYPIRDTAVVIVRNSALERITWGAQGDVSNYTTFAIQVMVTDSAGRALPPKRVIITSSDTSILYFSDTLYNNLVRDTTIQVQARHFGAARLTARTDSATGVTGLSVIEVRPYRVTLVPDSLTTAIGDTSVIGVSAMGTDGNSYQYPLSWRSSNPAVATVDSRGHVVSLGGGVALITGTTGSVTGNATVVVRSAGAPVVSAVTPSPLVAGSVGTIHGSGFTAVPGADTMSLEGVGTTAIAATDSTITFQLPPGSAFVCDSVHNTELVISSGGRYLTTVAPFTPAVVVPVNLNGPTALSAAQARCLEVNQAGSLDVLVDITNTGTDPTQAVQVQALQTVLAHPAPPRASPPRPAGAIPAGMPGVDLPTALSGHHLDLVRSNRAVLRQLGSPLAGLIAARASRPALSASAQVNGIAEFRIPQIEYPDFCSRYVSVGARLAYEGQHIRIFEDTMTYLRGQADAAYAAVGQQFDALMWNVLTANFGNPLALDSLLDRSGKVSLLLSPVVNSYGAGGFTVACDLYSEADAPSSNTGEVIYGEVPLVPGLGYQSLTVQAWQWAFPGVLIHEAKHLTAYAERISRREGPEDLWLEEATADAATEIWARAIYGLPWKGDGTYANTVYCDVRPGFPNCGGRPFAMFANFEELYAFALAHDSTSTLGPESPTDGAFLGGGWFLLRWTLDQYAGSESAFLRQLTTSPTTGVGNLTAAAGHPIAEILPPALLALRLSGSPQPGAPRFPSWNLPDVFNGMAADFPGTFGAQPVAEHADGDPVPPVPGGSFMIFDQGGVQNTLVQVTGPGGVALPGTVSVFLFTLP